jgi:signal transduction histidine kinase
VGSLFVPLIGHLAHHLLFSAKYRQFLAMQQLIYDLSLIDDLDALSDALLRRLQMLMNLEFAVLLVCEDRRTIVRGSAGVCSPNVMLAVVRVASSLQEWNRGILLPCCGKSVLIVPLRTQDAIVGRLCLGPKVTGRSLNAAEYALVGTLAGHLAALMRNFQLRYDLQMKVQALEVLNERLEHAQEDERARLAADLHDEPLQTAIRLHRELARLGREEQGAPSLTNLSSSLIAQLRAVCAAICPTNLGHLGLGAALEALTVDLAAHSRVPIVFQACPDLASAQLSSVEELIFYRAAQEALNNCLRHACAHMIQVSLRRHHDAVRLCVADDGVGFVVPRSLHLLALDGHLGLAGLSRRVQRANGSLYVISTPGAGTVVRLDLPASGDGV